MKLCWLTDIHLNFLKENEIHAFLQEIDASMPDAIIISGDIGESYSIIDYLKLLDDHFTVPIYFVLGNHDFYRGSINRTKEIIQSFLINTENLYFLDVKAPIKLTQNSCILGHSSWADGQFGDFNNSLMRLNDYVLIHELSNLSKTEQLFNIQKLALKAVDHFDKHLSNALDTYKHIILVTHVPPFKEACWHMGNISDHHALPHFSCKIVGDTLVKHMKRYPEKKMTVYCGHTHSEGYVHILENLEVYTGKAEYEKPEIQKIIEIA